MQIPTVDTTVPTKRRNRADRQERVWLVAGVVALSALIFWLDLAAPAGAACGVLYVLVVLLSLRFPNRKSILFTAGFCSFLILAAALTAAVAKPWLREPAQLIANGLLQMFAVWVAALFGHHIKGLERSLLLAKEVLEKRVEERSVALQQATQELQSEVDQRRRAQQELGRSEAHYLSLIENLQIHVIRKDLEGRFTLASQSFCELSGIPLDGLIGKTDHDLYPEHLARKYRADDLHVMQERTVINDVERNQLPDGTNSYVQVIKMPIVDDRGAVVGIQGIFWDVTVRMKAEDELRESEARKRAIFETAVDCILFLDEAGTVVEVNQAALRILRCKRNEVVGKEFAEIFVTPVSQQRFRDNLLRYQGAGEMGSMLGRRLDVELQHKTGETFIADIATQPIPLKGSAGFAIFLRDVTEQRRYEEALRTARDAAEAASRAKSQFVANMSHEIRTPMNAIVGVTELLLDSSELTRSQRDYLLMIQQSADALLGVINDILDFSKIEAGKLDLDEADFEIRESIGDMMKAIALRAHGKGLELAVRIAPSTPDWLYGDQNRLRQVITNLVGNAIKFTAEGEVVLEIAPEIVHEDHALLKFSVTDTGIGIAADRREAVFAAFEQADNSTTRKYGGTGLGLAIAARLVQLMGGKIWLESQAGEGTTFYFTAQFKLAPAPAETRSSRRAHDLVGLRGLFVDDNATHRDILVELLQNWQMLPTCVPDAAAAMSELKQARPAGESFDVVLLDAQMPTVDGFELAVQIAANSEFKVPIVMLLTAGDHQRRVARCEDLGVAAYLMKPVKQSELFDAIALAVHRGDDGKAVAEPDAIAFQAIPLDILLVEDSLVNQKVAIGMLKRRGHHIQVANNGREGTQAAKQRRFDLILMDVQMPEMDGLEATTTIRTHEQASREHVPIIAMTAHAMKSDREACLEAGMDGYIAKPIRAVELFQTIASVLERFPPQRSEVQDQAVPSPVDWTKALEITEGDSQLLTEIVQAFVDECPKMLQLLRSSLAEEDSKTFRRAAHTLKGSLRYFGARAAFDRAHELECAGRDEQLAVVPDLLGQVEADMQQIEAELRCFLDTGKMKLQELSAEH
ncbi:MAG: response regulator [Planctomycetota bacterium]